MSIRANGDTEHPHAIGSERAVKLPGSRTSCFTALERFAVALRTLEAFSQRPPRTPPWQGGDKDRPASSHRPPLAKGGFGGVDSQATGTCAIEP